MEELRRRGIAYTLLTGSVDEREARAVDVLGGRWR